MDFLIRRIFNAEGASNPLHNMRQGSNLDALAPSVCNLNNGGAEGEVIDDNATGKSFLQPHT